MPVQATCDVCQAQYNLKDEHAGKKLRCQKCGTILTAPSLDEPWNAAPAVDRGYHNAFARDKFLMNQKRISVSEKYYVFDERQNPILFIERPAHFFRSLGALLAAVFVAIVVFVGSLAVALSLDKDLKGPVAPGVFIAGIVSCFVLAGVVGVWLTPKRHIYVYTDNTKQHLLLEIYQDRKFHPILASYTVQDPTHGRLGRFEKNYLYNLFRKRWYVFGPDGQLHMLAMEDSLIMSLLRRLLPPIIAAFVARTNFVMQRPGEVRTLGEFNRRFALFDKYVLDMTADREHALDRRMAVALGVLLDTGERRYGAAVRPCPPDDDDIPVIGADMLHDEVEFEAGMSPAPAVSLGLIAGCVAAFVAQVARGGLNDLNTLRDMGAMDPALVEKGEVWRLLSATFLHGSFDHLFGNVVILYILGMGCEHAFGRSQFFGLYVASGVCGSLLSLTGGNVSVGASGAIFGLAGALVATLWRHRGRLHVRDRRIGLLLLAWAGYQLMIGAMLPQVDNRAHLGGLLCGTVLGLVLHPAVLEGRAEVNARPASRAGLVLAASALLGTAVFFVPRLFG